MGQAAVEIDPDARPADGLGGAMPMPLAGSAKEGGAGAQILASLFGLQFTLATGDERKAEFAEHAAFLPFERVIGRMSGTRVGLVRTDAFPAGMGDVKGLLKEPVVQGQGMGGAFWLSHFDIL